MSWDVKYDDGIYLPEIDFWLDPHHAVDRAFVSHAHSDHVARHRHIICTKPTAQLIHARIGGRRNETLLDYDEPLSLTQDVELRLYSAGHILGSAECWLKSPAGILLYTGDFKLASSLTAAPCATPHADCLIMETTFGLPRYQLPRREEVIEQIFRFCIETLGHQQTPVLFCYSLGKSQEVLANLNRSRFPVALHPQAMKLTKIYEHFGVQFPPYVEFTKEITGGHVVICPPQALGSSQLNSLKSPRFAVITGWALDAATIYRYGCEIAFPLSDHADYLDLLKFVAAVQPKLVYTVHGFAQEFSHILRSQGIEAWALGRGNQLELDFTSA